MHDDAWDERANLFLDAQGKPMASFDLALAELRAGLGARCERVLDRAAREGLRRCAFTLRALA
jgi:hypothetical protein